jgi:F420-dependent oxidoreductase-like protein
VRIGIQLPCFTVPGGPEKLAWHLTHAARWIEAAGADSLWVMDHLFQIPPIGAAERDMLESYTALAYLAAVTQRVRLGTLVTGVTYRHPGILVKTVTALDVLSGGRAWFGIGAAWFEREHRGLGVPYPPLTERFERLEECLQIALQMWSGDNGSYRGKHYQLAETLCVPAPLSRPHPPILIGGSGERKTLRLVAQYANACNLFGTPETAAAKLKVLREHCDRLGRDYAAIEKTVLTLYPGDLARFLDQLAAYSEAGVDTALLSVLDLTDQGFFETLGNDIVPGAARLRSAS